MNAPSNPSVQRLAEAIRVLELEGQAILQASQRLKSGEAGRSFEKALDLLSKSLTQGGKIVVTGVGKSGKVAQKIAATLSSTGSHATFLHPTEGLHGDLGILQPHDVVLALSHTGNTEELLRLIPSFKRRKVTLIAITGNASSQLAAQSDAWIDSSIEQEACPHNLAPTTSTTLALALGDALAVTLMQIRGFNPSEFAENHPGGSLGRRLTLKVSDLMQKGDQLPILSPNALLDEALLLANQKRLGAVLIVENQKLIGIITEGDFRKALLHREKFFSMNARSVMTPNPIVAAPQMMAQEALELMENRPFQISVLPVVDPQTGHCVGLIRLHDLVKTF